MKPKITLLFSLLTFFSFSTGIFAQTPAIDSCLLRFNTASELKADIPIKMLATAEKTKTLRTQEGLSTITISDAYRILFSTSQKQIFANMKIESSNIETYSTDSLVVIQHLNYLNSSSAGMEKKLIHSQINGFTICGMSRDTLDESNLLSLYTIFPKKGIIIYLHFNNANPNKRDFSTLEEFRIKRNRFIEEFTLYLKSCIE
jgi:hypothetical protein